MRSCLLLRPRQFTTQIGGVEASASAFKRPTATHVRPTLGCRHAERTSNSAVDPPQKGPMHRGASCKTETVHRQDTDHAPPPSSAFASTWVHSHDRVAGSYPERPAPIHQVRRSGEQPPILIWHQHDVAGRSPSPGGQGACDAMSSTVLIMRANVSAFRPAQTPLDLSIISIEVQREVLAALPGIVD